MDAEDAVWREGMAGSLTERIEGAMDGMDCVDEMDAGVGDQSATSCRRLLRVGLGR